MANKDTLIVLDFDGFLINSYKLLQITFEHFGLDIGDEDRFKHRRKFLKYLGGGKEFLGNLVSYLGRLKSVFSCWNRQVVPFRSLQKSHR